MREIGHFIGGKAVKGASGRFGDIFDPNTGEVQAKVALAKHSEVEHAIANAEGAQPAWGVTNPQRRPRDVQVPGTDSKGTRRSRQAPVVGARQDLSGCQG